MKKFLPSLLGALALFFVSTAAFANDYVKFKGWKQAETTHFRFIYEAASEPAAQAYAKIADEAWENIARIYAMPQEKTNVYVFSRLNIVNAYTFFSPPEIVMFDSPVLNSYFGLRDDWMKLFFTHELIHIANITFEDKQYLASKIFGEAFRGIDYSSLPGWALEGLTTVLETELTRGGRGRSPYFEIDFKAVTLDNAFIPYRLIGTEQEPPYSQIYVMGYLIMRSIADQWGIQALADIERNRSLERSWEESVKLVTGQTPQDIYREVKIALEKKYMEERKIPEGKIISPNDMNVNYSQPAIVFDDGSIIAAREDMNDYAVVLLKPSAKDGMQYYGDDNDLKETILFRGAEELTADRNMNIYYTTALNRYDRAPNNETKFQIYKWSKDENGNIINRALTSDESSYYQPAVSRDGSLLVAVEQKGLKMRIVKVDTQTGDISPLFQDENYSFIQPALNEDGSKIAFLLLKEDRACIALGDPVTGKYKIVNNTEHDFIIDPSSPYFNADGTLTFCSNDRGRLEIYEALPNSDGQTFTCKPMLSDPIGALWAYKNDMGIFYRSKASTGSVIKIKPAEEWGKIADFDGPSPAGEIMTFGQFKSDYPDFDPYAKKTEQAASEASETDSNAEDKENPADDNKDPVKHRSEKAIAKLENLDPATTELINQKSFRPFITTMMVLPFINVIEDAKTDYFGIGAFYYGSLPRLQMLQGILAAEAFYYPSMKNFTGSILAEIPGKLGTLDLCLSRENSLTSLISKNDSFTINNYFLLGYTLPIFQRDQYSRGHALNLIAYAGSSFSQSSQKAFSLMDKLPYSKQVFFHAGLDYTQVLRLEREDTLCFSLTNIATGNWDFSKKKLFAGFEGEYSVRTNTSNILQQADLVLRYTDYPAATIPSMSRAHFNGFEENCLYPGKILLSYSYIVPGILGGVADFNLITQGLASFGKNHIDGGTPDSGLPLNFNIEKKFSLSAELCFDFGGTNKLALGYTGLLNLEKGLNLSNTSTSFYLSCKLNWLRF